MPPLPQLGGRRALVTGASSGIGVATAELLARQGCDVALVARGRPGLEVAAEKVRAQGARAVVAPADLAHREQAERAVAESAAALGGLDLVVVVHASVVFGDFDEVSPEDFERTWDVTFAGAMHVLRASLPHLERTSGVLIAVGSTMTKVPLPTFSSYATSKHALRGLLGAVRAELRMNGSGVQLCLINPGSVDTPLWPHVTSASGRLPRRPPDAYTPQTLARAIVRIAADPRPEFSVGLEARAMELLFGGLAPVADVVLRVVRRVYRSGPPARGAGSLHTPVGAGIASTGRPLARPSFWAWLRLR